MTIELINLVSRKRARLALAAALAFGATLLSANPSSAYHVSFGTLASICGKNGGNFKVSTNGGYACEEGAAGATYCTGKGQCNNGPAPGTPSFKGHNGVPHQPPSAGAASAPIKSKIPVGNVARVGNSRVRKY